MRTQGEKKHVMAFKISAVSCKAEWDAHILQVRPNESSALMDSRKPVLGGLCQAQAASAQPRSWWWVRYGLPDNWTYQLNDGWSTWGITIETVAADRAQTYYSALSSSYVY